MKATHKTRSTADKSPQPASWLDYRILLAASYQWFEQKKKFGAEGAYRKWTSGVDIGQVVSHIQANRLSPGVINTLSPERVDTSLRLFADRVPNPSRLSHPGAGPDAIIKWIPSSGVYKVGVTGEVLVEALVFGGHSRFLLTQKAPEHWAAIVVGAVLTIASNPLTVSQIQSQCGLSEEDITIALGELKTGFETNSTAGNNRKYQEDLKVSGEGESKTWKLIPGKTSHFKVNRWSPHFKDSCEDTILEALKLDAFDAGVVTPASPRLSLVNELPITPAVRTASNKTSSWSTAVEFVLLGLKEEDILLLEEEAKDRNVSGVECVESFFHVKAWANQRMDEIRPMLEGLVATRRAKDADKKLALQAELVQAKEEEAKLARAALQAAERRAKLESSLADA